MALPIAALGLASTIGGGMLQAQGAQQAGDAQLQQNYYQAGIAKFNQQIAQQNARYAYDIGEQQALNYGIGAGERMGQIRAAQSSSGFDVNSGSAVQARTSQQFVTNLDEATIRANAAKTAYDYTVQGEGFGKQATLYEMAGTNAAQAGDINAQASMLSTVGSVASKWLQGNQMGLFNPTTAVSDTKNFFAGVGSMFG